MTAREPSAVEVIAEALAVHYPSTWRDEDGEQKCSCGEWLHYASMRGRPTPERHQSTTVLAALKAAGFVVATRDEIRAMSPSEQAEVIGGEVEGHDWWVVRPQRRVIGPWREVQP